MPVLSIGKAEIARRKLPSASIEGAVTTASGAAVDAPVVVAEKDGTPYAWTLGRAGRYAIDLTVGAAAAPDVAFRTEER